MHSAYIKTAEKIIPTLKESKFLTDGVITPEEVRARFRCGVCLCVFVV